MNLVILNYYDLMTIASLVAALGTVSNYRSTSFLSKSALFIRKLERIWNNFFLNKNFKFVPDSVPT